MDGCGLTVIDVLVIQSLRTSVLVSGMPLQYNLLFKAIVVLFMLWRQARLRLGM